MGWKYQKVISTLETKRKVKSKNHFERKKFLLVSYLCSVIRFGSSNCLRNHNVMYLIFKYYIWLVSTSKLDLKGCKESVDDDLLIHRIWHCLLIGCEINHVPPAETDSLCYTPIQHVTGALCSSDALLSVEESTTTNLSFWVSVLGSERKGQEECCQEDRPTPESDRKLWI